MCHFHMAQILRRYLTKNPNLNFNKELWEIWYNIDNLNPHKLKKELFKWYCKHSSELTKGFIDQETGKWFYSRERSLKAYKSLTRFAPYLFTYQSSKWIPNTNNSIEGSFRQMKKKINIHSGLRVDRKAKIIHHYLIGMRSK